MKCTILSNGEYGPLAMYRQVILQSDLIICADGGADVLYEMELIPHVIIGDMDSISPESLQYFSRMEVQVLKYPRNKDFTDTQLAIAYAEQQGAEEVIFLGTLGKRLDHTLSNLFSSMDMVRKGKKITHYSPECIVYVFSGELEITGNIGEIISVMALTDVCQGVYETGVAYPLEDVQFEIDKPYAVSNHLIADQATIKVREGILAVFHYK
ncbi:MAG: thiamine diphosphokinase [Syntrophomonadaceae bacterium]|nr:thiamine diphosphokinase [Syntrophomonadaceae bacterium]